MEKFIIGWGLSGGFGGIHDYEIVMAKNIDQASSDAYERACEYYESYNGLHGLRSVEQIMEEEEFGEMEAQEVWEEEREGWLDYNAWVYTPEKAEEFGIED